MLKDIVSANWLGGYCLHLCFEDGVQGVVDLGAVIRCLFSREDDPPGWLPGLPFQSTHKVEMGVAAHDWNCMLPAKSRDPQVIGRNWLTRALQFQSDGRVVPRGLNANIQDCASVQHSLQGPFVSLAVA